MSALAAVRSATEADWNAVQKLAEAAYSLEAREMLRKLEKAAAEANKAAEAMKAERATLDAWRADLEAREKGMEERVREEFLARVRAEVWGD